MHQRRTDLVTEHMRKRKQNKKKTGAKQNCTDGNDIDSVAGFVADATEDEGCKTKPSHKGH